MSAKDPAQDPKRNSMIENAVRLTQQGAKAITMMVAFQSAPRPLPARRARHTTGPSSKKSARLILSAAAATTLLLLFFLSAPGMGVLSFLMSRSAPGRVGGGAAAGASSTMGTTSLQQQQAHQSSTNQRLETIVTAALWSFFAGDALASPTHWFYGGFPQIQRHYGKAGITGYTQPVMELPGSILNKSNLSGGGRSGSSSSGGGAGAKTIIGNVINHGKQDLWSPSKEIHYHATLKAGENTLEAQLARVLIKSLAANQGNFDADHFRKAYVDFMTTPGSHNDTYASTCHRMFFANLIYKKLPPEKCPDDDNHNVATVDGLVLPTITALAVAARPEGTAQLAASQAAATAAVTRNSPQLERYAAAWGKLVFRTVRGGGASASNGDDTKQDNVVTEAAVEMAKSLGLRRPRARSQDEITACYLDSAVPALLDSLVKFSDQKEKNGDSGSVWQALLANANTGGENVHRGSCLGAVLGAAAAEKEERPLVTSQLMIQGLYQHDEIGREIQALVKASMGAASPTKSSAE